jgi:protein TonB
MTRSYFSYFLSILVAHFVALTVTIQLSRPEMKEKLAGLKLNLSSTFETEMRPKLKSIPLKPRKMLQNSPTTAVAQQVPSPNLVQNQDHEDSSTGQTKVNALEIYKAELRAMIDRNKYYPVISKRLGQTGTVVVAFTLLEDGNIIDVRIDRPSRFDRLNSSALDAVMKVERFKPLPKELGEARMDVKVPVTFVTI